MTDNLRPRTAETNADLWGARVQDWSSIQEGMCRPVYAAAFDRVELGPGDSLLDVGCGAGLAVQMAAERGAAVSGLDASADLLAVAQERVPAGEFQVGDLEQLPYFDSSFDLVTGFNALQYAGNPGVALAEARRVVRRGKHVLVTTWGEPEGMEAAVLILALRPLMPPALVGAPAPFALSDGSALRALAAGAGLEPLDVFDVASPWHYADLGTALRGLNSSGVAAQAIAHSGTEAVDGAHRAALAPFEQPDGSYVVQATFRCLLARA